MGTVSEYTPQQLRQEARAAAKHAAHGEPLRRVTWRVRIARQAFHDYFQLEVAYTLKAGTHHTTSVAL